MGRGIAISAVLHGMLLAGALFGVPDIVFSELFTDELLTVVFAVLLGLVAWVLLSSPGFVAAVAVVVLFVLAAGLLAQDLLHDARARSVEAKALDIEVVTDEALDGNVRRMLARLDDRLSAQDTSPRVTPSAAPRTPSETETATTRRPPEKSAPHPSPGRKTKSIAPPSPNKQEPRPKAERDKPPAPPEPQTRPQMVISLEDKTEAERPRVERPHRERTPRVSVQISAGRLTERDSAHRSQPPLPEAAARAPDRPAGPAVMARETMKSAPAPRPGADPAVGAVFDRLAEAMPRVGALRRALAAGRSGGRAAPFPPSPHDARIEALARQGFPHAQFALAERLLTEGAGSEGLEKALALLRGAALSGHAPAQVVLAMLKAEGHGGVPDLGEAAAWLEVAAKTGVAGAASARDALADRMTANDSVRARLRAAGLLRLVSMMAPPPVEGEGNVSERLQLAAVLGDIEQVHSLLARDADPDMADKYGRTPLIESAWRGYVGIARALLRAGASLETRDKTGKDALQWAAINGHARVVSILLEAGADVNARDGEGFTALMRAAWNGHRDIVTALLGAGARTDIRNRHNLTALDYARKERHRAIVRLLEG